MMDRDTCIELYDAAGFALFPCGAGPQRKAPLKKGWQQTKPGTYSAESLPDSFGVLLRADVAVLDVDPRRYKARDELAELLAKFAMSLRETFVVRTGGDGFHLYYRKPTGVALRASVPGFPAIDVKCEGGFVVGAGSVHHSGNLYTIECGTPSQLADCPAPLLKFISAANTRPSASNQIRLIEDDAAGRAAFVEFLMHTTPAVEGNRGDLTTFVVACEGRDYGLSEEAVLESMLVHFNPRCSPRWSEDDLQRKVSNAFLYAQNPPGSRHPKALLASKSLESRQDGHSMIETITAKELVKKEFPEPRWAVMTVLPEGLTILAGAPKIGKSWMAYSLALAVASGGGALGAFATSQGEVLYLALEDNHRRLQDRLLKLSSENSEISDNLLLSCNVSRFSDGGLEQLETWLDCHPSCRLVIIDTVARFGPEPKRNMNAYENDYRFLARLQQVAIVKQIALVCITHLRKQAASDPIEQITGSTGITGAADAIWLLKRGRGESNGILTITGRDVEERELSVQFDKDSCQWSVLGDASKHEMDMKRREILTFLQENNEPAGPKEVAQALGRKEGNIKNLMHKMFLAGQLAKLDRGKYVPAKRHDDFDDFAPKGPPPPPPEFSGGPQK